MQVRKSHNIQRRWTARDKKVKNMSMREGSAREIEACQSGKVGERRRVHIRE